LLAEGSRGGSDSWEDLFERRTLPERLLRCLLYRRAFWDLGFVVEEGFVEVEELLGEERAEGDGGRRVVMGMEG
jgi:hypothetical protein